MTRRKKTRSLADKVTIRTGRRKDYKQWRHDHPDEVASSRRFTAKKQDQRKQQAAKDTGPALLDPEAQKLEEGSADRPAYEPLPDVFTLPRKPVLPLRPCPHDRLSRFSTRHLNGAYKVICALKSLF